MNAPAVVCYALLCSITLHAQVLMQGLAPGGSRQLFPADVAVLDGQEKPASLRCEVKPVAATLGFDLAFHTGYLVDIRLRDIAGDGNILTVIFRATPIDNPSAPSYFRQQWTVPSIPANSAGTVSLDGAFAVGPGDYKIDWLMRDGLERVCSAHWQLSVRLPAGKENSTTALGRGSVVPTDDLFRTKQSLEGKDHKTLTATILVQLGSHRSEAAALLPEEKQVLLSILQGISREPRIDRFTVIAFNVEQGRVLFREDNVKQINLAALRKAIGSLHLGTVALDRLAGRDVEAQFLVELAEQQMARTRSDALIFVGPKIAESPRFKAELLARLGETSCPVFYLSYNLGSRFNHGHDLIGAAVKRWRGHEFPINKPLDLLSAWPNIMLRIGQGYLWQTASRPQ